MFKIFFINLFLFLSFKSYATTFRPVKIEVQLKESQSFIEGKVQEITYEFDEEFGTITRVQILPNRWNSYFKNQSEAQFFYTLGGRSGEYVESVEGAARFRIGEKVVVLISNHKGKNWVHNLGLGKFSLKRVGYQEVMVNQIFPTTPNVGQISLDSFLALAERVQNKKIVTRLKNKYEQALEVSTISDISKKSIERKIASVEVLNTQGGERSRSIIWLILTFAALIVISKAIRKKSK